MEFVFFALFFTDDSVHNLIVMFYHVPPHLNLNFIFLSESFTGPIDPEPIIGPNAGVPFMPNFGARPGAGPGFGPGAGPGFGPGAGPGAGARPGAGPGFGPGAFNFNWGSNLVFPNFGAGGANPSVPGEIKHRVYSYIIYICIIRTIP